MGFFDLLALILDNLNRRKGRVAMTAVGVIIGAAAVIVLVSLGIGLQRNANEQLYGISDLTRIDVYPGYSEGSKIVYGGGGGMVSMEQEKKLTNDALEEIRALPGVAVVIPRDYTYGEAVFHLDRLETWASILGVGVKDLSEIGLTAQVGSLALERGTVVVGAMIPNNFYDPRQRPGQLPPDPPDLYDKTLRLVLVKYDQEGIAIRKTLYFKVAGVVSETRGEADWNFHMSLEDVTAINEWFMGKRINRNKDGYQNLVVRVEDPRQVLEINDAILALGYQAYTPQSFVQGINSFFLIMQIIFGGVGAIALLVAAIGIANTMTMAILERTREIGLMKAIGATNRDVLSVFLGEAAGIGLIGGLGGVLLGWAGGQVLNVLAISYLAGQAAESGGPPPSTAVFTPLWLPLFALGFSTFIGLISGLYPALRAATLVPVNALKYE